MNEKKTKKMAQKVSELELRMWYDESVFKKVSQLEYSEKLARDRYEAFLQNNLKQKSPSEPDGKPKDDEDKTANEPLFKIKLK